MKKKKQSPEIMLIAAQMEMFRSITRVVKLSKELNVSPQSALACVIGSFFCQFKYDEKVFNIEWRRDLLVKGSNRYLELAKELKQ